MGASDDDTALGWIELGDAGRWGPGRFHLLDSGEWVGPDDETVEYLNGMYSPTRRPGHGGIAIGAEAVATAAAELGAAASQIGPPGTGDSAPDPDIVH